MLCGAAYRYILKQRGQVSVRFAGSMTMPWRPRGVRERGADQLTAWESFKVFEGKIHAVEAFMRILPINKRNGGSE
jgi:hypothetical protein